MLLTVMDELINANRLLPIKGNQPNFAEAKDVLEKSGFFKYVTGHVISEKNRIEKNTMLTIGNADKSQTFLPKVVHQAMETVWGNKGRNPLLYTTAFEMIRNSCDHAFKKNNQIKWYLSSTHLEKENTVKFSFADNGKGILKTLTTGKLSIVTALFRDNNDILETAFKDGIKSRTGLSWRGKGLPTIYENYVENYIKNLIVISNDVFIDFDRNINEKLTTSFDGTYYFWIVNTECEKLNLPL